MQLLPVDHLFRLTQEGDRCLDVGPRLLLRMPQDDLIIQVSEEQYAASPKISDDHSGYPGEDLGGGEEPEGPWPWPRPWRWECEGMHP